MALDANYRTVVDRLEDIHWVREWNGRIYTRQLGPPKIACARYAWATVLITQQDWRSIKRGWDAPRFILTRWYKERGAWRLKGYFRIPFPSAQGLGLVLTPEYLEEIKNASSQE